MGQRGRADQRLQRGGFARAAGTEDQHVGTRPGGVDRPRRLVVLERPVDDPDREHQVPGGAVFLLPRPTEEPVHQVFDRHRHVERRLPQPVGLEVDPAQLIDDHRADSRRPDCLFFFVLVVGLGGSVAAQRLAVPTENLAVAQRVEVVRSADADLDGCEAGGKQLRPNVIHACVSAAGPSSSSETPRR